MFPIFPRSNEQCEAERFVLQDDLPAGTFIAQCTTKLKYRLDIMSCIYGFPRFQKLNQDVPLRIPALSSFQGRNVKPTFVACHNTEHKIFSFVSVYPKHF
jgi:hypothetical protein